MTESNISDIPRIGRESLVVERLPLDGGRVIDIGCGEGWLTHLVAPKTVTTIGIDPSAIAIERARAANGAGKARYCFQSMPTNAHAQRTTKVITVDMIFIAHNASITGAALLRPALKARS